MHDLKTTHAELENISKSKEFHNAEKYIDLLKFLLDMTEKGIIPKEKDIARAALQKGADFDPLIDTSVRVYMYRLRKKLEDYYKNEGRKSKIQLVIPKGEYHLEFHDASLPAKQGSRYLNLPFIIITALFLLALMTSIYLWNSMHAARESSAGISASDEIWGPLLNNNRLTLLVFGDHFFYASRENDDYTTDKHIRYHKINSLLDLQHYIAQQKEPNIKYYKDPEYFLDRYCTWSLLDILPIFHAHQKKLELKLASELTWNDFNNYNILFVGSFKTLGILESVFSNLHITYELFPLPNKIIIRDSLNRNAQIFNTSLSKTEPYFQREYSFIAKIPGPNNNNILMMVGFNYIGVENAVKLITQPSMLSKLKQDINAELNAMPRYFEIVYEVQGFAKTSMYSNYIRCYPIPDTYSISRL